MRKAGQNALRLGQDFGIVGEMTNSDAVTALAALAQDSRLAIFRLLVQNAPAGLTVGVIAEQLELPAPTLSFHLKTLTHAGLISTVQEGRFVRCRAEMGRIDGLIGFLTDNCCGGHPEVCKPLVR
jgi:ArsR family transcriptional regulator